MKKRICILICLFVVVLFVIASFKTIKVEKVDNPQVQSQAIEDILMQVVNGEKEFIDASGKEILISSLTIEDSLVKLNRYTFVDLDGDERNELIAITDSYYGYYLVLHIENNIIYGYNIPIKDLDYINKIGIILNKEENSIQYGRLIFSKSKYKFDVLASSENYVYKVNKKECTEVDFNSYQEEFAQAGLIKYRISSTNWMKKEINRNYSIEIDKSFQVSSLDADFLFAVDGEFENFIGDFLQDKISVYYIDSNNNSSQMFIKRLNDSIEQFTSKLQDNSSVAIFDENTQYIAIIINNDKLSSEIDNNYDIYYFKYYNKNFQFLSDYNTSDLSIIFDEGVISNLQ